MSENDNNPSLIAKSRLTQEFANLCADPVDGCLAQPQADDIFQWQGLIQGPLDSPYQYGAFALILRYAHDYPLKPPVVTFKTKIYHPNIEYIGGAIGISILDTEWTPALTISHILLCLRAFLAALDVENFMVPEIAAEYLHDQAGFEAHARDWTKRYALQCSAD